jgi:hypothetical protein
MGRSMRVAMVFAACLAMFSQHAAAGCNPNKPAPPVAERFVISGATVKDKVTGLTWQRCSVGQKWKEKVGCIGLVDQVKFNAAQDEEADGWRLPRPAELRSLLIGRCRNPAINEEAFPDMDPDALWYWSFDGNLDQVVNFGDGNPGFCSTPKCKGNSVRLVKRDVDMAAVTP